MQIILHVKQVRGMFTSHLFSNMTFAAKIDFTFGKYHAVHDISSVCLSVCHQFLSDTITEKILQISSWNFHRRWVLHRSRSLLFLEGQGQRSRSPAVKMWKKLTKFKNSYLKKYVFNQIEIFTKVTWYKDRFDATVGGGCHFRFKRYSRSCIKWPWPYISKTVHHRTFT